MKERDKGSPRKVTFADPVATDYQGRSPSPAKREARKEARDGDKGGRDKAKPQMRIWGQGRRGGAGGR